MFWEKKEAHSDPSQLARGEGDRRLDMFTEAVTFFSGRSADNTSKSGVICGATAVHFGGHGID